MRWLSVVVAASLAGCGFDLSVTADGGITGDGPRPDGPTSDVTSDSSPLVDTDGDGHMDADDNCPEDANPDQFDFDDDDVGDVCDPCPHIKETVQVDGDGDGIGNACDPRPAIAGDTRLYWLPMRAGTEITGWEMSGGNSWAVANALLTQSSASNTLRQIETPTTHGDVYWATELEVTESIEMDEDIGACGGDAGNQYFCCTVSMARVRTANRWPNSGQINAAVTWPGVQTVGSRIAIAGQMLPTSTTCKFTQGPISLDVEGTRTSGVAQGAISLYTINTTAAFRYLFVVAVGQ